VRSQATLPPGYTVGGTITGLTASGLVLQNNGGDNLSVASGASSFTFSTLVQTGGTYSVTIQTRPTGLSCSVFSATGTMASSNVTSVNIRCSSQSEVYSWGTFTDQFNGTVRFDGVAGTFGGNSYSAQTLFFMKCSQGQTWNSGTNNCSGGASYQYCNNNTNDCNGGVSSGILGTFLNDGFSTAFTTCDILVFAGISNWRVSTKNELKTLIQCINKVMPDDYPSENFWCKDGNFVTPPVSSLFPNTIGGIYWTASSVSSYIGVAYFINFAGGAVYMDDKPRNYPVRCVSGP
jgi:hypothetical protein